MSTRNRIIDALQLLAIAALLLYLAIRYGLIGWLTGR